MKCGFIPAIIVLTIVAITVNVYYGLIKKPARSEAVTIETITLKLEKTR